MLDPDDRFDLVCAFEVIEHIEDDTTAISEWATHVAPGGTMILSAPAWTRQYGAWDEYVGHFRRYEPEALDQLLAAAGCTDVSHHLYGWPLGFVTEAARNRVASKRIGNLGGSMSTRTAASGRTFQPNSVVGVGTRLGTVPFAVLQKLRPGSGVGVVSIGVRP
jgi:SAM-dependent methyltransferase